MAWPSSRSKTFVPYGDLTPSDMNALQDQYLRSTGILDTDLDPTTVAAKLGLDGTGAVRRGKSIIATEESVTSTSYATPTTPDTISNLVLPTDGLIAIWVQVMWKYSVAFATAQAAVFLDSNQVTVATDGTASPANAEVTNGGLHNTYGEISSFGGGLLAATTIISRSTTGQILGTADPTSTTAPQYRGGPMYVFAAAGTYSVSIKYKANAGAVTVKNRILLAHSVGF